MSAGFTPGPWRADDKIVGWWGGECPAVAVMSQVGPHTWGPIAHCKPSDKTEFETIANARLIAAAPDGYIIAERLVEHLRDDFRIPADADEGWIVDTVGHALGGIYLDALTYLAKVRDQ